MVLLLFLGISTWQSSVCSHTLPITELVRKTMAVYFNADAPGKNPYQPLIQQFSVAYKKPAGVFVTLSHQGKPRACWGSIHPQHSTTAEATVYATLGALTKDYRYKPISKQEWKTLKPQVTIIKSLEPIANLHGQNPLRDGLMVRQGSRSGVILPGEAKDATYQLVLCKLKAGIRPGETFQLYRIIADVYQ